MILQNKNHNVDDDQLWKPMLDGGSIIIRIHFAGIVRNLKMTAAFDKSKRTRVNIFNKFYTASEKKKALHHRIGTHV